MSPDTKLDAPMPPHGSRTAPSYGPHRVGRTTPSILRRLFGRTEVPSNSLYGLSTPQVSPPHVPLVHSRSAARIPPHHSLENSRPTSALPCTAPRRAGIALSSSYSDSATSKTMGPL
ncbi:hypothetical protein DFH09DRAFT_1327911 [Mycena vulgaris]|nr:hypothetical protein DFH09DRAFT_1327911 [Mycena vulgaris]